MEKPKYNIGEDVWLMRFNKPTQETIYGIFPRSTLYRNLLGRLVEEKDMSEEDWAIWKEIPEYNRQLSAKVTSFFYVLSKEEISMHLHCANIKKLSDEEVLSKLYGLVDESFLFKTKQNLIDSL